MNIWHDISPKRITPEDFICVIEISKGSRNKYELDKDTGLLILDRILHTSTHYPANYGFIPRTYGDDGDPLDVLLLCSEAVQPLTLVRAYPIGVISMLDNGKNASDLMRLYNLKDYAARKTMESARRFSPEFCRRASELILETDRKIKTSFDDPQRLLEMLILQLAQEASR